VVKTAGMKDATPYTKFPFACQPDCSVFAGKDISIWEFDTSAIKFVIEFKVNPSADPFLLDPMPQTKATSANPLMSTTSAGRIPAGQITAYATLVLSSQYCMHTFSVLISKDVARLIRWDCAGAIITAPIYYDRDPQLYDFLICYDNASPQIRGHDTTVLKANVDEERCTRRLKELSDAKTLFSMAISSCKLQPPMRYIACGPCAQPDIPAGRWTRMSIVYDVQRDKRVILKDSWRISLEDIMPEGDVYKMLHKGNVPNIPCRSMSGDIGDDDFHCSWTDKFVGKFVQHVLAPQLIPHQHYQLVLDTIG